jgi:glycosyltransferase involved in cell wall biosynthesis
MNVDEFDRKVAGRILPPKTDDDRFIAFVGQALHTFRAANKLGFGSLQLEAANSHVENVYERHQLALRQYPGIESEAWINKAQVRKTLQEYELANTIVVASEYTRRTFIDRGFSPLRLERRVLMPSSRFSPPARNEKHDEIYRIAYVGSLTVGKGIPLLLDAFSRLQGRDIELTLVGGWSSRGMKKFIRSRRGEDIRIKLAPGDPLPALHKADVYVHPSYEDGFAYSAAEALACGVPVIVTSDTGMKELVVEGVNGYVIPTGDCSALLERLDYMQRHPLKRFAGDVLKPGGGLPFVSI